MLMLVHQGHLLKGIKEDSLAPSLWESDFMQPDICRLPASY